MVLFCDGYYFVLGVGQTDIIYFKRSKVNT